MDLKNYKKLTEVLNELNLGDTAKISIIETFNQVGIDLDLCSTCMDITLGEMSDGCETYCSVECFEYSSYANYED